MATITRVQSPQFLLMPPIAAFLDKAWAKPSGRKIDELLRGLVPVVDQERTGVFLGEEKGLLKAFALVFLPVNPLHDKPQVHWFYSHGSATLRDQLVTAIFDYVTRNGYNSFWIIFDRNVKAYERLMKKVGSAKPVGQIFEVSIGGRKHVSGHLRGREQSHQ